MKWTSPRPSMILLRMNRGRRDGKRTLAEILPRMGHLRNQVFHADSLKHFHVFGPPPMRERCKSVSGGRPHREITLKKTQLAIELRNPIYL